MKSMQGEKPAVAESLFNFYNFCAMKHIGICDESIEGLLRDISKLHEKIVDISYHEGLINKKKQEAVSSYENFMSTESITNNEKLQNLVKLYKL